MSTTTTTHLGLGVRVRDRFGRVGVIVRHSPTLPAWVVQRRRGGYPVGAPLTYLDTELSLARTDTPPPAPRATDDLLAALGGAR